MKTSILSNLAKTTMFIALSATMYSCAQKIRVLEPNGIIMSVKETKCWICFPMEGENVQTGSQGCEWFRFPKGHNMQVGQTISIFEPTIPFIDNIHLKPNVSSKSDNLINLK